LLVIVIFRWQIGHLADSAFVIRMSKPADVRVYCRDWEIRSRVCFYEWEAMQLTEKRQSIELAI
jgi:hypothetical protein